MYRREELYHGECLAAAPDMVLHFSPGFDIKGSMRASSLFGRTALTGMHTFDDSLFCVSKPGLSLDGMDIIDVAPTILGALGLAGAASMDGEDRWSV